MCGLIGATVIDIGVDDTRSTQLRLDKGRVFTIPLDQAHRAGSEAAHFIPGPNGQLQSGSGTLSNRASAVAQS